MSTSWPENMGSSGHAAHKTASSKPPQQEPQKTIQSFWAGLSGVAKTWIIAGAAAVAVLTIILIAVSGSSSPPAGYLNVTTLENALTRDMPAYQTATATCVPGGTTDQFQCSINTYDRVGTNGRMLVNTVSGTITVTPDGSHYVGSNTQQTNY